MAIIQGLLALLSRSLGSILSALFGWAVGALFGPTERREKIWLSGLVGAAAAWPLLMLGVIWPRVAAFALVFLPIPQWVPTWGIRVVWVALAVVVPFALGLAMAARSRGSAAPIPGATHTALDPAQLDERVRSPLRRSWFARLGRAHDARRGGIVPRRDVQRALAAARFDSSRAD